MKYYSQLVCGSDGQPMQMWLTAPTTACAPAVRFSRRRTGRRSPTPRRGRRVAGGTSYMPVQSLLRP